MIFAATLTSLIIFHVVYNIFLHPLRNYPGPLIHRATMLPKLYHLAFGGDIPQQVLKLHQKYGLVVRVAPKELALQDPRAWKDIYARTTTKNELPHDMIFYRTDPTAPPSLLNMHREEHDKVRKILSNGFSERAIRAQAPVIAKYVDKLMTRLEEHRLDAHDKTTLVALNMRDWLAYTMFDIIGDLTFGSSFGCLENSAYHAWVTFGLLNMKVFVENSFSIDWFNPPKRVF
ncbi:cytochrome P450 [Coniochaeta sp. 2T2.1]|nr:cytochrome P450 [Coniochaeta sp. 2T2.1]